jgi:hypothetical protein
MQSLKLGQNNVRFFVLRFLRLEFAAKLQLSGMSRVEYWELLNMSAYSCHLQGEDGNCNVLPNRETALNILRGLYPKAEV